MKIIVTVKQVPDTSGKVAVNPDGTLDRASMQTIINPDDKNAIEAALQLKDQTGCRVTAVTMGPPPAEGMLRELMAMGVDEGVLVTAREFGGSDTYATSQILAAAIDTYGMEDDDLILAGRQAIDGDTAQVGPQIAEKLHLPQVSYAGEITKDGNTLLINIHHISHNELQSEIFPSEGSSSHLSPHYNLLYNMSSTLPEQLSMLVSSISKPSGCGPYRGMAYNASASELLTILNIGSESEKGNLTTKAAHEIMAGTTHYNFVGNVESSYIFTGKIADVVVADAFVGNSILKMAEALYRINFRLGGGKPRVKNFLRPILGRIVPKLYWQNDFWEAMNAESVGGLQVMGINAPVMIGHGSSSARAICSMIKAMERDIKSNFPAKLREALKKSNDQEA